MIFTYNKAYAEMFMVNAVDDQGACYCRAQREMLRVFTAKIMDRQWFGTFLNCQTF